MYEEEKAVVQLYVDKSCGDASTWEGQAPWELFADDVVYELIGSTPSSGVMRGLPEIQAQLFNPFWERLAEVQLRADEIVALEDGRVAMFGGCTGKAKNGRDYNQQYLYIFTVKDGKITHILKHCDTALIETAIFHKDIVDAEAAGR